MYGAGVARNRKFSRLSVGSNPELIRFQEGWLQAMGLTSVCHLAEFRGRPSHRMSETDSKKCKSWFIKMRGIVEVDGKQTGDMGRRSGCCLAELKLARESGIRGRTMAQRRQSPSSSVPLYKDEFPPLPAPGSVVPGKKTQQRQKQPKPASSSTSSTTVRPQEQVKAAEPMDQLESPTPTPAARVVEQVIHVIPTARPVAPIVPVPKPRAPGALATALPIMAVELPPRSMIPFADQHPNSPRSWVTESNASILFKMQNLYGCAPQTVQETGTFGLPQYGRSPLVPEAASFQGPEPWDLYTIHEEETLRQQRFSSMAAPTQQQQRFSSMADPTQHQQRFSSMADPTQRQQRFSSMAAPTQHQQRSSTMAAPTQQQFHLPSPVVSSYEELMNPLPGVTWGLEEVLRPIWEAPDVDDLQLN